MPRIYLNAKEKVEDCISLSASSFRKSGAFKSSHSGTLSWANGGSMAYTINVDRFTSDFSDYATPYLKLSYSTTDNKNQQRDINQKFYLSKIFCKFGEYRYWFMCTCGKRVGVLYKSFSADSFACRHCYNLTYESRNLGGFKKKFGMPLSVPELEEMEISLTKRFYKGLPTKRYSKYLRKCQQFNDYHTAWYENFMKKCGRINK